MRNPQAVAVQGGGERSRHAGMSGFWDLSSLGRSCWWGTCLPSAPRGRGEGLISVIKHAELWERWALHFSESPGPGTLVTSSYTSKDLFSSSYLDLFLNILE